jgi:hypothetical protein
MKKKDLIETSILLLGLWLLYSGIMSLVFFLAYGYIEISENPSPENSYNGYLIANFLYTVCYGAGVFLCFKKREWLIQNISISTNDEVKFNGEITKRDLLETGIIVLAIATIFLTLPDLLDNLIRFFKSKISDTTITYEFTFPFIYFILPLLTLIFRDKILEWIYPQKKTEQ